MCRWSGFRRPCRVPHHRSGIHDGSRGQTRSLGHGIDRVLIHHRSLPAGCTSQGIQTCRWSMESHGPNLQFVSLVGRTHLSGFSRGATDGAATTPPASSWRVVAPAGSPGTGRALCPPACHVGHDPLRRRRWIVGADDRPAYDQVIRAARYRLCRRRDALLVVCRSARFAESLVSRSAGARLPPCAGSRSDHPAPMRSFRRIRTPLPGARATGSAPTPAARSPSRARPHRSGWSAR